MPLSDTLISPAELAPLLEKPDIVVVDASWYLPADRRDTEAEFFAARIPGARFFDIEAIADLDHACPHMLPSEQLFAERVQALGIGGNTRVVVYDSKGLFSAARAWWMFRVFGHDRVQILEGGLPAWVAAGYGTEQGAHIPMDSVAAFQQKQPDLPVHVYAADHGFNCDQRDAFDATAASQARERTLALFNDSLAA
jgi:3-mercaptopyruvate sulfurtransferase SseA